MDREGRNAHSRVFLLILLGGTTAMSLHGYLYAMVHEVLKTAILAQCIVQ